MILVLPLRACTNAPRNGAPSGPLTVPVMVAASAVETTSARRLIIPREAERRMAFPRLFALLCVLTRSTYPSSPDGAKCNPGSESRSEAQFPHSASLHAGYKSRLSSPHLGAVLPVGHIEVSDLVVGRCREPHAAVLVDEEVAHAVVDIGHRIFDHLAAVRIELAHHVAIVGRVPDAAVVVDREPDGAVVGDLHAAGAVAERRNVLRHLQGPRIDLADGAVLGHL